MKTLTPITITTKAWLGNGTLIPATGLHSIIGVNALVYTDIDLSGNKFTQVGEATVTVHLFENAVIPPQGT
jgi:hypothetical protein